MVRKKNSVDRKKIGMCRIGFLPRVILIIIIVIIQKCSGYIQTMEM